MKNETYAGFEIRFDEKNEVWFANVDSDGKPAKIDSQDGRIQHASLKKVKELIDLARRSKFKRMPVFVRSGNYRRGGGQDEKYLPEYSEATLTSVSPGGNAYVVKKGEKHADKTWLRYGDSGIILDTPENRKLIAEFEMQGEIEWRAEREQERIKAKMKQLDGPKTFEAIYGKTLE